MYHGCVPSLATRSPFAPCAGSATVSMIPLLDRVGPWSVRRRLLALLLAPVGVLLVTGLLLNYLAGIGPVRAAFDRSLAAAALIVATHVRVAADGSVGATLP